MIVQRHVYKGKWGCREKLVAMLKEEGESLGRAARNRIYTRNTGPWPTVVLDMEFESIDERDKSFAELAANPDHAAFLEKLGEVVESLDIQLLTLV